MNKSRPRNFSPHAMFTRWAEEHQPELAFKPGGDFASWKEKTKPEVLKCLGDFPERVDPNPELIAEWEHRGLKKQRWHIDLAPHLSTGLQVNIPLDLKEGEQRPAILCWHGHGNFGKDAVMGNDSTSAIREEIAMYNYEYGQTMAEKGFVTFAVDWMGNCDLDEKQKPNSSSIGRERDWCNLYYLQATMFGMTSISIHVTFGKVATDVVSNLPFVDPDRIGVMGLSGGGTCTTWTAFCDERIKAAEIICYSDLWEMFGMRDINYCGMQVAPGLYKLVDLPDLQGLLAPLPLLVDIGVRDSCFLVEGSMKCFNRVKEIYATAGVADSLELDYFPGGHAWGGNKSETFFKKHLGG